MKPVITGNTRKLRKQLPVRKQAMRPTVQLQIQVRL
jgi:hypothetical protein